MMKLSLAGSSVRGAGFYVMKLGLAGLSARGAGFYRMKLGLAGSCVGMMRVVKERRIYLGTSAPLPRPEDRWGGDMPTTFTRRLHSCF